MNLTEKKSNKRTAFTIIELLTVMSIITILISILVPAMNKARQFAKDVKQKNQLRAIGVSLEMFHNDFGSYPPSDYDGPGDTGTYGYCGAMKLAEAMIGQDLLGFHQNSRFREDYFDGAGNLLYDRDPTTPLDDSDGHNLDLRVGPYLELGNANAHRLWHIYGNQRLEPGPGPDGVLGGFNRDAFVLCDVYDRVSSNAPTGKRYIGMPILYYKADTGGNRHPHFLNNNPALAFIGNINDPQNFYDYSDNDRFVQMRMPWKPPGTVHLMDSSNQQTMHSPPLDSSSANFFYHNTHDEDIAIEYGRPHKPHSFILISAGFDGEYGTSDDIFNFAQ
ncbi:type II secretion system protein [Planctomycetota bacterium]